MPVEAVVLPEVLDNLNDLADVLVGRKFQRTYRHLFQGDKFVFEGGGGGGRWFCQFEEKHAITQKIIEGQRRVTETTTKSRHEVLGENVT